MSIPLQKRLTAFSGEKPAQSARPTTDIVIPLPLPLDMPDFDLAAVLRDDFVDLQSTLEKESSRLKLELKYMELTRRKKNVLRGIVLQGEF